ncbi:MAG: aromatic ring-hydroxylating dioxygenase subunit alpha [Myxococcota bacterium]|nr:aromatic ring-hydroxylating dioxygenase subunit alpha [Myxococcota bacterium]
MNAMEARMKPPESKGHLSVAQVKKGWHVACRSDQLEGNPIARTILGWPLAFYREPGGGGVGAVLDRCPHRNVRLSQGAVDQEGCLVCPYHGWRFDRSGACRGIPGLLDGQQEMSAKRSVPAFETVEQDGFIWVWGDCESQSVGRPLRIPFVDDPDYVAIHREYLFNCTLHAALENALDVPHTSFVHRGDFRGQAARREIVAERRRILDGIEVEYIGEPPLSGPTHAEDGTPVVQKHWDRFFMPGIAQVEYQTGAERHQITTFPHTPISDFQTRGFLVSCWRLPDQNPEVIRTLEKFLDEILAQDVAILADQTANVQRFGGEAYGSTGLDLMGPEIWRMLRQAEQGLDPNSALIDQKIRLSV